MAEICYNVQALLFQLVFVLDFWCFQLSLALFFFYYYYSVFFYCLPFFLLFFRSFLSLMSIHGQWINIFDLETMMKSCFWIFSVWLMTVDVDTIKIEYPDVFTLMDHLWWMGESNACIHRRGFVSRDTLLGVAAAYEVYGWILSLPFFFPACEHPLRHWLFVSCYHPFFLCENILLFKLFVSTSIAGFVSTQRERILGSDISNYVHDWMVSPWVPVEAERTRKRRLFALLVGYVCWWISW